MVRNFIFRFGNKLGKTKNILNDFFKSIFHRLLPLPNYSGLNLNQDKATKPQTVQEVRQGEATLYRFKFKPL
ncbi:hypothetical protein A9R06_10840 [Neisseria gonorrhoeae]|nr:hypothetical protein A9R06_10840 [Neisseria gonorrhoeae]